MESETRDVLLVDGAEFDREAIARVLSRFGYTTHVAASLAQARALLREPPPDGFVVALLEVRLPDGLGLALMPQLRLPPNPCATLLMSGSNLEQAAELAVSQGVHGLLRKPFTPAEFRVALEGAHRRTLQMRAWLDPTRVGRKVDSWIDMVVAGADVDPNEHESERPVFLERMSRVVIQRGNLTPGVARVVPGLLLGSSYAEIAAELEVSVETVKTHVKTILGTFGLKSAKEIWRVCIAEIQR